VRSACWEKKTSLVDACTFLVGLGEIFVSRPYEYQSYSGNPLILDCGANIGLSALFFKQQCPSARVLAFEADPEISKALVANIRSFGLSDVTPRCEAIGTTNGSVVFSQRGGFAGRIENEKDTCHQQTVAVPCLRLKDLLADVGPVDFLKMDIEGAEVDVLNDCRDSLGGVRNLFVEYHSLVGQPQRLHETLEVLAKAGFRVEMQTTFGSAKPFLRSVELGGMDFQTDIYAVRR